MPFSWLSLNLELYQDCFHHWQQNVYLGYRLLLPLLRLSFSQFHLRITPLLLAGFDFSCLFRCYRNLLCLSWTSSSSFSYFLTPPSHRFLSSLLSPSCLPTSRTPAISLTPSCSLIRGRYIYGASLNISSST